MVAQLVRLRLSLLAGALRGKDAQSAWMICFAVLGLAGAVVLGVRIAALQDLAPENAAHVVVAAGALVMLGWTAVQFTLGGEDPLDPGRFATIGIKKRDLAVGLLSAGGISVPAVGFLILAIAQLQLWTHASTAGVAGLVAAVLIVISAVLFERVARSVGARVFGTRRRRSAHRAAVLVVVVFAVAIIGVFAGSGTGRGSALASWIWPAAGWTPWGAAWAFVGAAANGQSGAAAGHLAVALCTVAGLLLAWWNLIELRSHETSAPERSRRRVSGWLFGRFASTKTAAVAARSLAYWARDPRYRAQYLILIVVPIVVVPLGVAGVPWAITALVPLPLMAFIAGLLPHNDAAYDGTAIWLHVASGIPGWSDRIGRIVPLLLVGIPGIVLGVFVTCAFAGRPWLAPAVGGVSICALLTGLGLSSVMSAWLPYPAVRPGGNPFRQPQTTGSIAAVSQGSMVAGIALLTLPAALLEWCAVVDDSLGLSVAALVVGLAVGGVVLVAGVLIGGRLFDRHGPDLLATAQRS